jgi:hypothetical protein
MLPNLQQWNNWTLPSKYSFVGVVLAIIGIFLSLTMPLFESQGYQPQSESELINRMDFLTKSVDNLLPQVELIEPINKPYLDVKAQSSFAKYAAFAGSVNIINSATRSNPHFHPHKEITRAEAAKILATTMCHASGTSNCFSISNISIQPFYTDVEAYKGFHVYLRYLIAKNILNGEGAFYPGNPISIKQSLFLIAKANKALHRINR